MLMYRAESTQTLQVRVLRLVLNAAVHNEYGLLMCAVAGSNPGLSNEGTPSNKASALGYGTCMPLETVHNSRRHSD